MPRSNNHTELCHPERSRGTCGAPFGLANAQANGNRAELTPSPPHLASEIILPALRLPEQLREGKAHRRSLGFARDDKGEGGDLYWEPLYRMDGKETAGPSTAFR